MDTSQNDVTNKEILQHLKSIEARISKIEAHIDLQPSESEEYIEEETVIAKRKPETDEELEFRIGQYWFANPSAKVSNEHAFKSTQSFV